MLGRSTKLKQEIYKTPIVIQGFFFEAMRAGYAAKNSEETSIAELPGYKVVTYRKDDLRLVDMWCTNPNSNKSAGTTTIWFKDEPLWIMQYGGEYKQDAIPVLKEALLKAYEHNIFAGGRGPVTFQKNRLLYDNNVTKNFFGNFEGQEVISSEGGIVLGYHDYRGMFLT